MPAMNGLQDKKVVLGITGGIAAYKCPELVRRLREAGAEVRVVMSEAAAEFVAPLALQAVSGQPVRRHLLDAADEAAMDHIALARWADLVLVAPATANVMAKLAHGFADDLLTTLCLASEAPLALAPAMNQAMWRHPATADNAARLAARGVHLLGPASGSQACGDVGPGRMLEPGELVEAATRLLGDGALLAGCRLLITAGPTREALDPVRYLSNRSSGKMGFAVAAAAAAAGARVTLVAGPVALATPAGVERVDVESAGEMREAVLARVAQADVFVATAAVADYRVVAPADRKIKKHDDALQLSLVRNPDILAEVAALADAPFTVGFAAETDDILGYARDKLERKGLDMIAANRVGIAGSGFEADDNALHLLWRDGERALEHAPKARLAEQLVAVIAERMGVAAK